MTLHQPRPRELAQLWIVIGIALLLALYRLSVSLLDWARALLKPYTDLPVASWISNFLFAWLLVLLWLGYRRWREAVARQQEVENVLSSISPDTLMVVDTERNIVMCNPSVTLMFGYEPDEVIKQKSDLLYFDRRVRGEAHEIFKHLESVGFHVGYATGRRKDGSMFPLEIITGHLAQGRGAVVLVRDITERRRAEEALRESDHRHRLLAEHVSDLIWTADLQLMLTYVSKSVVYLTGYTPEEVNGKSVEDFLIPESLGRARAIFAEELALEQRPGSDPVRARVFETEVRRKDGSMISTQTKSTFLRDKSGQATGILGVTRDIGEHKRMEEELRQAQKMDAVGRLAGGVAHDFNNLLMAITGYADLLLHEEGLSASARRDIDAIKGAAGRAALLTGKLLTFSRKNPVRPTVLSLNALVADMEDMLRHLIGENIELVTTFDPQLRSVKADLSQIQQVLMNLVLNARDAMPEGGRLAIKTENVALDDQQCKSMPDARSGDFACLSVSDAGRGMDAATAERIFEPFFTTKEGKGTGLGLSLVYGIVKQHAGWIKVTTAVGQGSTFKIYLPSLDMPAEPQRSAPAPANNVRGHGERILLVEDEESVRDVVKRALQANGYTVQEAGNVAEATGMFAQAKGAFDLVLTDVVLPDKTGVQMIDELRTAHPALPVLVMSGYTDGKSHREAIQRKDFPFLQKPVSADELLKSVRAALKR